MKDSNSVIAENELTHSPSGEQNAAPTFRGAFGELYNFTPDSRFVTAFHSLTPLTTNSSQS